MLPSLNAQQIKKGTITLPTVSAPLAYWIRIKKWFDWIKLGSGMPGEAPAASW